MTPVFGRRNLHAEDISDKGNDMRSTAILTLAYALLALSIATCANAAMADASTRDRPLVLNRTALHLRVIRTESRPSYVCTILTSNNLLVREFADSKTHIVFAVTWRAKKMPDIVALVGFDPGSIHALRSYRSLHLSRIETSNLLYEAGGHMGFYLGRVIRVDLMPIGVNRFEVRP
jgi:hypothetical protein